MLLVRLLLFVLGRTRDSVVEGGVFGLPFLDPDAVPPAVKPLPPQRSRRGRLNKARLSGRPRSSLSVGALRLSLQINGRRSEGPDWLLRLGPGAARAWAGLGLCVSEPAGCIATSSSRGPGTPWGPEAQAGARSANPLGCLGVGGPSASLSGSPASGSGGSAQLTSLTTSKRAAMEPERPYGLGAACQNSSSFSLLTSRMNLERLSIETIAASSETYRNSRVAPMKTAGYGLFITKGFSPPCWARVRSSSVAMGVAPPSEEA